MIRLILKQTILFSLFFSLLISNSFATEIEPQPLIDIRVGIELHKLEDSASRIAGSIETASQALQKMAKNPNIDTQQQQQIINTFKQIDKLALTFDKTISQLPNTIKQLTPPISTAIDNLFSNIQLTIILVLIGIVVLLIIALIAVYYWILKPSQRILINTTKKLDNMASALKITAQIVEKSTDQQLLILNTLAPQQK
ncbi:hypothetical protein [Psychromonas hadalis]|uniref:hypothetical protein n=1 Tax=Psychromonas hadalis TaxID=211669 RepID=UPI0003B65072|nr:hypothetical protein [Psychromonas hadalis]